MKTLDILDPHLNLYQKFFVEASAGCGKTFSIEHAYIRFLLNIEKGWMPSDILVLTFTKEATKELKMRIRLGIEKALDQLENPDQIHLPYLLDIVEKGDFTLQASIRVLRDALANFDQAQIFTLHSFCFRMLKEHLFDANLDLENDFKDEGPSLGLVEQILKDFLSFKLDPSFFSSSQVRILFRHYRDDFSVFLRSCIQELSKERNALSFTSFSDKAYEVAQYIDSYKKEYQIRKEQLIHDLFLAASSYKGGHNRAGVIREDLKRSIVKLADLFENPSPEKLNQFLPDCSILFLHLKFENKKKKTKAEVKLFYPHFIEHLNLKFEPLLEEIASPFYILSHLISYAQNLYQSHLKKNRALTPNNLLKELNILSQNSVVAKKIAFRFQSVIVDEFQDTDPIQWQILSSIFLNYRNESFPFYLVGDPKQSIYAFRRADIYTYLKAAKEMGENHRMVLDRNYRSQPNLITALNDLFEKFDRSWIDLPKLNETLDYHPVKSCDDIEIKNYQDDRGSIHFFVSEENKKREGVPSKKTEEEKFFPFIVNEILRLHHEENISLNSFALLVRDRFQGARLKLFLKKYNIAFKSTRPEPLKNSKVAAHFLTLYQAVLEPKNIRTLQNLELNPFFSFSLEENDKEKSLHKVMARLAHLKEIFLVEGFLSFYSTLMSEPFLNQNSFYEEILSLEEGMEIYLELEQIKDLIIQQEIEGKDPQEIKIFLEELSNSTSLTDSSIMQRQHIEKDAVHILSLHLSKGLEFEIVFALGLVNRTLQKEDLIPIEKEQDVLLVPPSYSLQLTEDHQKEIASEKLRQLYVALTRAKQRLYIPGVFTSEVEDKKSSPIELFMRRIGIDSSSLMSFIESHPYMSATHLNNLVEVKSYKDETKPELIEPVSPEIHLPKNLVHSFSSIATKVEHRLTDLIAPHNFAESNKTIHTLPAGAETGTLYHYILEKINFQSEELNLDSFLEGTPYLPWKEILEENVQRILNLELKIETTSFSLNKLSTKKMLKEIEFLFPIENEIVPPGFTKQGDYLQGVIDLVFQHEDKYYILDYKTNWLGPNQEDYQNLEQVMNHHHYFLQAKIYKEALRKYLKNFEKRDFDSCFGGAIYLFIRAETYYLI